MKKILNVAFALSLMGSGCELTDTQKQAMEDALGVPGLPVAPSPLPSILPPAEEGEPVCYNERHTQPEAVVNRKVDLLFVFDTSGSMGDDRKNVAEGLDEFVRALPEGTDYRVAVMLAHSSNDPHSGRLYSYKSNKAVLDSQSMALEDIRAQLRTNMINAPYEKSGSGEMGLFSLNRAMDHGPLTSSRAKGFFREDAALAVVFISDENDVCGKYPAGVKPVPDETGTEAKDFKRDCGGITAEGVLQRVKELQGDRPFIIAGVVYNDVSKVPTKSKTNGVTQEEYGYGYMDIIALAKGISIDISGRQYEQGLADVGKLVSIKLNPTTEFKLEHGNVNASSVKVAVDSYFVPFEFDSSLNSVKLEVKYAGGSLSTVDIGYCEKKVVIPPTPTPSPTVTPSPTPSTEPTPEPTVTPSPTPTASPTPEPTPSPSPTTCVGDDCAGGGIGT